jgi:hypothetical protein
LRYTAAMWLVLLVACPTTERAEDSGSTVGLSPLDARGVLAPGDDDDPTPERGSVLSGSEADYDWGVLRGWVKVNADTMWETVTNPDVAVNRRKVTEWTVTPFQESGIDDAYVVNEVVTEPITVDYDLSWRHARQAEEGSLAVWEKTAGTEFVSQVRGSLVYAVVGNAIDFTTVFELATIDSDSSDTELFVQDFYASVLAAAHGEPLPDWNE